VAKLERDSYPGMPTFADMDTGSSFDDIVRKQDEVLAELKAKCPLADAKDLTGALLHFPAGDGTALYIVTRDKPLTVQHVPYCDAWHADACTIRGINRTDVRSQLYRTAKLKALFS